MGAHHHTRRSFLRGHAVSPESLSRALQADEGVNIAERRSLVVIVRRRAMACEFEAQLAASRNDSSMAQIFAALDLVEALEAQLTVYRDDSEVSRINQRA